VTGYWTTPMVGPNGGNIQTDIWKLTASRSYSTWLVGLWTNLEVVGQRKKASKPVYNILLL
jgi:hypothetical protein